MAGGVPVVQSYSYIPRKSKVNIWKLRDVDRDQKSILPFASLSSRTTNNYSSKESVMAESLENLISARAKLDLSRAAKKAVQLQHRILLKDQIQYRRRHLKTSLSSRKKQRNQLPESPRTEIRSAPPLLGSRYTHQHMHAGHSPPKIVVIDASQKSSSGHTGSERYDVTSPIMETPKLGENWKDRASLFGQSNMDYTPRSMVSTDSSTFLGAYSPDTKMSEYGYRTSCSDTPRTNLSYADWEWVRERLASRESMMERPESSLTFQDFLESLNPDSDEYDTDLEDNFKNVKLADDDTTGVRHYKIVCKQRGIAPARQVLQKLSDGDETFYLKHRYLNSQDTRAIAAALSCNTSVQEVNLAGNHIDDTAAKSIFSMLRRNCVIKRLDLSNNCLMNDDRGLISKAMKENSTLTHVSLSRNKLADKEALLLSEALRSNQSLEFLNLSHNQFSDMAGQAIAAALMENSVLTSLDLSWNMLRKEAGSALGKAMKINRTLRSLDLSYNGFGDEGTALFGRPLRHNTTLRFLSLAVNHIGLFGADRLAAGICGSRKKGGKKSMCALGSLNLSRNPLGKRGIIAFLKYMEKSSKLIDLRIDEVVLSPDALSLMKQINSSRDVAIFHEGQYEDDKQYCAIRLGKIYLQEIFDRNHIKAEFFFQSIDPKNIGVNMEDLKKSLEELKNAPSEIELDRILYCLNIKRMDDIRYEDIFKNLTPSVSFVMPKK